MPDRSVQTLAVVSTASDEANTLRLLATNLINAASAVDCWASNPGSVDLGSISNGVATASEALVAAIAAHQHSGRPSIEKLKWIAQVLEDQAARLAPARMALFFESDPTFAAAREKALNDYDAAYRASLDAKQAV